MKIHDVKQGSVPWLELHCGIPTASEFDNIVTAKFEPRTGEMPKSYLARKLAEKWGGPLPGMGRSWFTDQGTIREGEGLPFLEFQYGWKIEQAGFCTTDDGRIGCSPDGLLPDSGVELKCPEAPTHVRYLLAGKLPAEYAPQVYGSMYVTGRPSWNFVSYRRHMPPLIAKVWNDDEIMKQLDAALRAWLALFDEAWARLCDINGGPPPEREPMVFADDIMRGQAQDNEPIGITP